MMGARSLAPTWLRRLVARSAADELGAFVAPDARLARAAGLDVPAAGLRTAATPRHASVLVLVGPIPEGLAAAAAVAYAQMPRPRAILSAGSGSVATLPAPDVEVDPDQRSLLAGVVELRRAIADASLSGSATPFEPAAAATRREYACPMHPDIVSDAPGSCPICGMDLVPRDAIPAPTRRDQGGPPSETRPSPAHGAAPERDFTCPMHPEVSRSAPGACPICGMALVPRGPEEHAGQHVHSPDAEVGEGAYACPMHPEVTANVPGTCPLCGMRLEPRPGLAEGAGDRAAPVPDDGVLPVAYTCPMHPEIVRTEPGRCPLCGMNLIPTEAEADNEAADPHAGHAGGDAGRATAHRPDRHSSGGQHRHAAEPTPPHHAGHVSGSGSVPSAPRHGDDDRSSSASSGAGADHPMAHQSSADHAAPRRNATTGTDAIHPAGGHEEAAAEEHVAGKAGTARAGTESGSADSGEPTRQGAESGHGPSGDAGTASHPSVGQGGVDHGAMDHASMDHAAMGHDMGGGFMSMVAVTRDLPRSRDGLPMEWIDVPFGPLFPGLPGGLALTLTLDGDGVASATTERGVTWRGLESGWPGPADSFAERLSRLDPLSPFAYRLLGLRAVEAATGTTPSEAARLARVWWAEWERVRSHLGWLAELGGLIGDASLADRAGSLHLEAARLREASDIGDAARRVRALATAERGDRALRVRLRGVGSLAGVSAPRSGPVARAAGQRLDARLGDPEYAALRFAPSIAEGDDALARLNVRLDEIVASLDLLDALPIPAAVDGPPTPADASGTATVAVETPRGAAELRITVERGRVVEAALTTPTDVNIGLVPDATAQAEVADALVAVASLDLSPWERDR